MNKDKKVERINYNLGINQLLEFKILFPDEVPLSPDEYMIGGSRNVILKAAIFLLNFSEQTANEYSNTKFLDAFFSRENSQIVGLVNNKISELEKKGITVSINNTIASLKLFEYFFSREEDIVTLSNADFEINLFKAYLVFNSEYTKAQEAAFTSTQDLEEGMKIPMMMFCGDFPASDKIHFDIKQKWATQTIKAIYLFKFLETNEKTKPLLAAFLKDFNRPTWQEYLKSIMPLVSPIILNENGGQSDVIVERNDEFDNVCAFIDKLVVHSAIELEQSDFLTLRARPFYKIEEGIYRIIFNLFVVEKIFKGIYFFLRDVNDALPREQKIIELKSLFGYEFSEKILLYAVLESIFTNQKYRISGKEIDDLGIQGGPDYYIHKGSNILIFESKDFLIRADKKESFDFKIYNEEFERILYFEEKSNGVVKKKAVLQLISNVERILKMEFKADMRYHYKDVHIYPILITHDHQYDALGFNTLINNWFQDELENLAESGLFVHFVEPLTVINIDTLIFYQAVLAEYYSLNVIIDAYHKQISKKPQINIENIAEGHSILMETQMPFSYFTEKYIGELGANRMPSLLKIISPALFNEEDNI